MSRIGLLFLALTLSITTLAQQTSPDWRESLARAAAYRQQGQINRSLEELSTAQRATDSAEAQAQINGELGATLYRAGRYAAAEAASRKAYEYYAGAERARYALDLGNIAFGVGQ